LAKNKGLTKGSARECVRILGKMIGNKARDLAELFGSSATNIDLYEVRQPFRIEGTYWRTPLNKLRGIVNKCYPSGQLFIRESKGESTIDVEYLSNNGSFNYTVSRKYFKHLINSGYIQVKDTCNHG